jgi:cytochrome b6-f complex iron-sulfur subunit
MERRQFLSWVGVGMVASSLPVAIAACSDTEQTTATDTIEPDTETVSIDTSVREDGYQALATVEQVATEGSVIDRENTGETVLMLQNPETSNITALNPTCTHQGCTVEYKADQGELACPCHGSKFGLDGTVINGPAEEPLATYETKTEDGLVLVKVG